jgi:hypothetical protein
MEIAAITSTRVENGNRTGTGTTTITTGERQQPGYPVVHRCPPKAAVDLYFQRGT